MPVQRRRHQAGRPVLVQARRPNWKDRRCGFVPRVENADIHPTTRHPCPCRWLVDAGIHVEGGRVDLHQDPHPRRAEKDADVVSVRPSMRCSPPEQRYNDTAPLCCITSAHADVQHHQGGGSRRKGNRTTTAISSRRRRRPGPGTDRAAALGAASRRRGNGWRRHALADQIGDQNSIAMLLGPSQTGVLSPCSGGGRVPSRGRQAGGIRWRDMPRAGLSVEGARVLEVGTGRRSTCRCRRGCRARRRWSPSTSIYLRPELVHEDPRQIRTARVRRCSASASTMAGCNSYSTRRRLRPRSPAAHLLDPLPVAGRCRAPRPDRHSIDLHVSYAFSTSRPRYWKGSSGKPTA